MDKKLTQSKFQPKKKEPSLIKKLPNPPTSSLRKMLLKQNLEIVKVFTQKEFSEVLLVSPANPEERNFILKKKIFSTPLIMNEQMILEKLKGIHLEKIFHYEVSPHYILKFSTQNGPSLKALFKANKYSFSTRTICNIGISMLNLLEKIHERGIIHNNICPSKILIGADKPSKLFLIDFSQASSDIESLVKEKINISKEPDNNCFLQRTANLFSSLTLHLEKATQRIDDIEALCYTLLYFFKKGVLFKNEIDNYHGKTKDFKLRALGLHKLSLSLEKLCEGAPSKIPSIYLFFSFFPSKSKNSFFFYGILFKNVLDFLNYFRDHSNILLIESFERLILYLRNFNPAAQIDYLKLKDILVEIKNENKLEKKTEDWFEWLGWGDAPAQRQVEDSKPQKAPTLINSVNPSNKLNNNNERIDKNHGSNQNLKIKNPDYAINLIPISEEAKNQMQRNRLTDKLQHLDDIKFKNAFARRNSPKKMFIPLSTLTDSKLDNAINNFNSLQEIPLPADDQRQKKSMEMENLDFGDTSPQKLSEKVKAVGPQSFNFK